jgi:UDP-2,4-diacetamido-2,4,6-trideoxy-beta-L-altropyranose hydrolase
MLKSEGYLIPFPDPDSLSLHTSMMEFRNATEDDAGLLFEWSNDPLVRLNSFHPELISWETHLAWFQKRLASPQSEIYIFSLPEGRDPVGMVRFETDTVETIIGITLAPAARGKGLSAEILSLSSDFYLKLHPDAVLVALIKTSNIPSYKAFLKAGFGQESRINEHGAECYRLVKQ